MGKVSMGVSGAVLASLTSRALPVSSSISAINSPSLSSRKSEPQLSMRALPPCRKMLNHKGSLLATILIQMTAEVNYLYGNPATGMKFWDKVEYIATSIFFPPKLIRPRRVLFGVGNDLCFRCGTTVGNIHHQVITKFTHDKKPVLWKRLIKVVWTKYLWTKVWMRKYNYM